MKEMNRPEVTLENASEAQNVQKLDVCNVGSVNNAGDLFQYKCRQATDRAHDPCNDKGPNGEDGATDRAREMKDYPDRPKGAEQDDEERVLERNSEDGATDRAHDMNDRPERPEDTMPDDEERELEWRDEPEYRDEEHGDRIEETGDVISRERELDVLKEDAKNDEAVRQVLERERAQRDHKMRSKAVEQVPVDSTGFPLSE